MKWFPHQLVPAPLVAARVAAWIEISKRLPRSMVEIVAARVAAWIEILYPLGVSLLVSVAARVAAWIEIGSMRKTKVCHTGRRPCGGVD